MTEPSRLRGRGWPLVILAGLVVLLVFVVMLPAGEMFAGQGDEAAQARQDLVFYRTQIAARPQLEAELSAIRRRDSQTTVLLGGTNTALAAAGMQSLMKDLVERHSGQLRSAQTVSASGENGLEKVEVAFELSLPAGSLKAATYELETGAPYLFIDDVDIRPEIYAGGTTGAPGNLRVRWTVHGYRRMGAP